MKTISLMLLSSVVGSLAMAATAPSKLVTASGAEFNLVESAPATMGVSYQDPWGLIWGDINGHDNYYGPNQVNFGHASSLCSQIEINGVKGRLATIDETLRVRETMRDPSYQPGPPYKSEYDTSKPALPHFPSRSWAICKSYFDFSDPSSNIESCLTADYIGGTNRFAPDAVNYMFAYRCVVETADYKALPLKYRVEYDRMSEKTPPSGAVQPPFASLGNIEKVKLDLILQADDGLVMAEDVLKSIDQFGGYYGKPDDESQLNLAKYSASVSMRLNGQSIQRLYSLDLKTVRESAGALADTATANRILSELQRLDGKHNVLIGKARQIGGEMKILNAEVEKLPSNTPESDAKLKTLWAQYKILLAKAVALKSPAAKNLSDYYVLVRNLGPAEELGQPTYHF